MSRYGGIAGIRDLNLLKSALGMPGATFNGEFLHTDVHEMAAAYLFTWSGSIPFSMETSGSARWRRSCFWL